MNAFSILTMLRWFNNLIIIMNIFFFFSFFLSMCVLFTFDNTIIMSSNVTYISSCSKLKNDKMMMSRQRMRKEKDGFFLLVKKAEKWY